MKLKAIGWDGMDSILLPQYRDKRQSLVKKVLNLQIP
jgi:hypothetical protein